MFSRRNLLGLLASVPLFPFVARRPVVTAGVDIAKDVTVGLYVVDGKPHLVGVMTVHDGGEPRIVVTAQGVTVHNCFIELRA